MSDDRLPTHIWVEAKIRESHMNGSPIFVVHKGNKTGGLVLLKLNNLDGVCRLLTQQRDLDGNLGWMNPLDEDVSETAADDYIRKELEFDSDLWVLEVETKELLNPFDTL
ncbi:MAG: DUF1491 family protein [Pseudomonadota bacterium]